MGPQRNQQNEGGQTGDEPELFHFIAAEHLSSCFPPSVSSASHLHPNDTHLLFPGEENQTIPPRAPAACFPLRTGATGREKTASCLNVSVCNGKSSSLQPSSARCMQTKAELATAVGKWGQGSSGSL